jgi:hypothetical protein
MEQIIVMPLLAALVLACCGASSMATTCPENDVSCFSQYAEAGCEPARMDSTSDIPVQMEITGKDSSGNCQIMMTGLSESRFRSMLATEIGEQQADEYLSEVDYGSNVEGKTAYCSVPQDGMYAFVTYGEGAESCSGPLMDGIMQIAR